MLVDAANNIRSMSGEWHTHEAYWYRSYWMILDDIMFPSRNFYSWDPLEMWDTDFHLPPFVRCLIAVGLQWLHKCTVTWCFGHVWSMLNHLPSSPEQWNKLEVAPFITFIYQKCSLDQFRNVCFSMRVGFFVSSKFNKSGSVSDLLQSSVIPPKIKHGIHEKPHGLGALRVSANAKGENKRKNPNSSWWLNQPAFEKSAGLAGVSSGVGLDDGLLVCTLLLLI